MTKSQGAKWKLTLICIYNLLVSSWLYISFSLLFLVVCNTFFLQNLKRHPAIRPLLENGTVLQYGARTLNEGGFQSIPYPVFPGGAIVGCSAGFLNVPKIKGTHTAMKSGMLAAESAFGVLHEGSNMKTYWESLKSSWIWEELHRARNYRPAFEYGLLPGMAISALEHYILKGRAPYTLKHGKPDHEATHVRSSYAYGVQVIIR
ncbi:putative electron-transferring-flavoprotein dehydrogenase [Helianthus annuus]|nr:putative electron-transferring-flavoprotein dehydrogenase [Helianthus annuus]KAJ0784235.1 putative electron-transferring-flavoprotein dehydrogenase [Helianthus annuus]KAJ0793444.1 putative electron-transferring-flavoprotein dehydrogenase [Helianthus annuus]